jgi:hypothetical protein
MNFLKLAQRTAWESGTVAGTATPATVTGQSGRLARIVKDVAEAWRLIQIAQPGGWKWQRKQFTGKAVTQSTARYGASGWSLTRVNRFLCDHEFTGMRPFTIYGVDEGVANEREIAFMPWETYIATYTRGTQEEGPPTEYSISPDGELCLGPIPDDDYTIGGWYLQAPQILADNDDVPEMPGHIADAEEDEHMIIVWRAIMLLAEHDEGPAQIVTAKAKYAECYQALVGNPKALPPITVNHEPIA